MAQDIDREITRNNEAMVYGAQDMGVEEGTGKEIGGVKNENATMDVWSYEAAGQDQK